MALAEQVFPSFSQSMGKLGRNLTLYRELSKSGIVALVLISVLGGFWMGHSPERPFSFLQLTATLFGILFLASGSSALNQLQETGIDAGMPRTSKRPLPSGQMSVRQAWRFVFVTLALGLTVLWTLEPKVFALGLLAVLLYNGFYTLWWKKRWAYAAVPGAVPGALPILMGYAAATGEVFAPAGIYLFSLLFFWQMPHFWVLALRYREDYAAGKIPTLPVAKGEGITHLQITLWCLAYIGIALLAPFFLGVRTPYLVVALPFSLKLLWELREFLRAPDSKRWLHFFLWVNFSLIAYIFAAVADLWSPFAMIPIWTR